MTPKQKEAWELHKQGLTHREIAKELGLARSTVAERLSGASKYVNSSEGVQRALMQTGLEDISSLHSGWLKTDEASLYFVQPRSKKEERLEEVIDFIKDRIQGITPLPEFKPPAESEEDLLTIYPIADAHIGMRAIRQEAGADYNFSIAKKRIREGMDELVDASPYSHECIILDVGDLMHADDTRYVTPKSKHQLDMAGTQYESIEVAIEVLSAAVFAALRKHQNVRVRILRGNHNENSYIAVMFALAERFSKNARVTIERTPSDFFVYQFGSNMFAAHHGDKSKPDRLVMFMANEWPEIWGSTKHRYFFYGHLHHAKLNDIGGVQVEQLRAVTSRDKHAYTSGYTAQPQMQSITYHRDGGEKCRFKINWV